MWELDCEESWAPKNWCFWTVMLEKTLRVPWTARGSNQSILKEISPGCSLEGMMLKLKFQYFGHLMRRVDSLEKTLMLGGIGGRRRRGWQRMRSGWHHRLDGHESESTMGVGDGQGGLACSNSWGRKESDTTEQLKWTELLFLTLPFKCLEGWWSRNNCGHSDGCEAPRGCLKVSQVFLDSSVYLWNF